MKDVSLFFDHNLNRYSFVCKIFQFVTNVLKNLTVILSALYVYIYMYICTYVYMYVEEAYIYKLFTNIYLKSLYSLYKLFMNICQAGLFYIIII